MPHKNINVGVSQNIGLYSDATEVKPGVRMLYTSGTPGMTPEGLLPEGIEAQSRQMWINVVAILEAAEMQLGDIIKVSTTLVRSEDIPGYVTVRKEVLGEWRPAFMLSIVNQLVRPDILVEVEIVAAR